MIEQSEMWRTLDEAVRKPRIAERFELRPPDRDRTVSDFAQASHPSYFPRIVGNALELLQATFDTEDNLLMLLRAALPRRRRIRTHNYSIDPKESWRYRTRDVARRGALRREALAQTSLGHINWNRLIRGVVNQDFGARRQSFVGTILVLNPRNERIYYLYDDRGLIVGAPPDQGLPEWTEPLAAMRCETLEDWRPRI